MLIRVTRQVSPPKAVIRVVRPGWGIAAPKAKDEFEHVKRFDIGVSIDGKEAKTFDTIKDAAGNIVDYQNVKIAGYLSTFKHVTESDRQGDYVEPGAFTETLKRFRQNPVMLIDHRNSVGNIAGRFTNIAEDKNGLKFDAELSNRPGNIDARYLVAEGHLKTVSMGGFWHYKEDGRGIFKADLYEGSLTPVPANPDARFQVRALTDSEKKFLKSGMASFTDFLLANQGLKIAA